MEKGWQKQTGTTLSWSWTFSIVPGPLISLAITTWLVVKLLAYWVLFGLHPKIRTDFQAWTFNCRSVFLSRRSHGLATAGGTYEYGLMHLLRLHVWLTFGTSIGGLPSTNFRWHFFYLVSFTVLPKASSILFCILSIWTPGL